MNILICDDDLYYAENCQKRVERLAALHKIDLTVEIVESGKKLLFFIDTKYAKVDLMYIDQNMPGLSGIETARALRERGTTADIVFYTVDDKHAIDGYDVEALHYIVKGKTSEAKFEEIFLKAVKRTESRHAEVMAFACAGEHRNIHVEEILYFGVLTRIVTVHYYENGKVQKFEFYSSLAKIEEFLYGKGFMRVHGSYLVSKKYIRKSTTQQLEMANGDVLPVGRTYVRKVKTSAGASI
ncbi:MAG: LytTR family DNA-binding domain-containing protein [Gemmiger sp.]|nr:LytTR family DNA-binding domain-containing protein [Gemmiger sp.]